VANYQRYTLQQLEDIVTGRVGNNSVFWLSGEKRDAINEALCVWQAMTGEWTFGFSMSVVGGHFYDVPKQLVSLQRVLYAADSIPANGVPLSETSTPDLDFGSPGWEGVDDTPVFWVPLGINKIIVSPAPTSGALVYEGIQETPTLFNPTDYVQLGDEELTRITAYAQAYCALKEGTKEFQNAEDEVGEFVKAAALRNNRLKATAMYKRHMGQPTQERQRPQQLQGRPGR
jgi:hypothetical protein